jgi:hypothetical protein
MLFPSPQPRQAAAQLPRHPVVTVQLRQQAVTEQPQRRQQAVMVQPQRRRQQAVTEQPQLHQQAVMVQLQLRQQVVMALLRQQGGNGLLKNLAETIKPQKRGMK